MDLIIKRATLEQWAGRTLSDAEVERLTSALPYSSVPDALSAIVAEMEPEGHDTCRAVAGREVWR